MGAAELRTGKNHRDENFPVASMLLAREHRRPILAFYRFARVADDVADHPDLSPEQKLAMLDKLDEYNAGRERAGYRPIKIGIGINTGIVIIGTIGQAIALFARTMVERKSSSSPSRANRRPMRKRWPGGAG